MASVACLAGSLPTHHAKEKTLQLLRKTANTIGALFAADEVMGNPELVRIILMTPEALLLVWRIQNMNIITDKLGRDQAPSG